MSRRPVLVGIDTGGTFTDLVALRAGRLEVVKVPSQRADPARAVRAGLAALGLDARVVLHYGSTVATNALLERRGARVVLLTTAGFEDVLAIGRQTRPRLYALEPQRDPPLVPRAHRIGVDERVLADGRIERRLEPAAVRRAVAAVARARPQAVAICLLHSYGQPVHERRLAQALARHGLHVTASHRLLREYREYERVSTTVVNAYVGPLMQEHLQRLGRGIRGGVRVMQSNGGLVAAATAAREPVRTILSGPAGGVVGAAMRAQRAGLGGIVTLDMGGTSTDVSVVEGPLAYRQETTAAGMPVRVPCLDIHTVGRAADRSRGSTSEARCVSARRVRAPIPGRHATGAGRSPP